MIRLEPFLTFTVDVGPLTDLGLCGGVRRRLVPLLGGTVTGAHQGTVLPGGADWQQMSPDGALEIAARYILSLDEGLVEVDSRGLRHASPDVMARLDRGEAVDKSEYYFRTAIRFYSSSPKLAHLNSMLAVSIGERQARKVRLDVFRVT